MGNNKKPLGRRIAATLGVLGALVMSSGVALMVTTTSAHAADCVPQGATIQKTDWVAQSPGEGWTLFDTQVTPATEGHWTDLAWNTFTGDDPATAPALDDPGWHATGSNPGGEHALADHTVNVPYNVSNGPNGKISWFLWKGTWVEGTPAVTMYKFQLVHPAVTCDTTIVDPPTDTNNPPTVVVSPPKANTPKAHTPKAHTPKAATVTPTVVHAGLAGVSAQDLRGEQGLALMVAGMVMLVAAGGLGLRLRGAASRI